MIQELLCGGRGVENCIGEEKKVANVNMSESGGGSASDQQQLRCPRCDSSNTKFCYYNNYNLTQPRHFCKTCRRYWTKGGALRNVPIGGGCRKNKSSGSNSASGTSSSNTKSGKIKSDLSKPNSVISLDHEITWGSAANSQLFDLHSPAVGSSQHALSLALLRASIQNPNPNSSSNPNAFLMSEPVAGVLNSQAQTLDPMIPVPTSVGGGSLWRSNINQQQQQQGLFGCEVQSGGIQEFYQRLRASANFCNSDHNSHSHSLSHHQGLNTASTILDPTPFPSSELGYWNSPLSWSDLHTTNGAFP